MVRTVIWYLHLVVSMVFLTPRMLFWSRRKNEMSGDLYRKRVMEIARGWALSQVKLSGAKFRIEGLEQIPADVPVLFVANHQGNFDFAVFLSYIPRPLGFVAKTELLKIPLLRTWMKNLDCVFMDRSDIRKSVRSITEAINIVKSGHSMVIFPEGTRSKNGKLLDFKAGALKIATKSKAPIIPVTIDGTRNIMENAGYRIRRAEVRVTVHPPVYTEGLTREEEAALSERIKGIIASALPEERVL